MHTFVHYIHLLYIQIFIKWRKVWKTCKIIVTHFSWMYYFSVSTSNIYIYYCQISFLSIWYISIRETKLVLRLPFSGLFYLASWNNHWSKEWLFPKFSQNLSPADKSQLSLLSYISALYKKSTSRTRSIISDSTFDTAYQRNEKATMLIAFEIWCGLSFPLFLSLCPLEETN